MDAEIVAKRNDRTGKTNGATSNRAPEVGVRIAVPNFVSASDDESEDDEVDNDT